MVLYSRNILLASCAAGLLAACGGASQPTATTDAQETQLQQREADLAAREAALAEQQAALAAAATPPTPPPAAAAPPPAAPPARPAPAPAAPKAAAARPPAATPAATMPRPAPAPRVVAIPAGTHLEMALSGDLTTRTAQVGDRVQARLVQDVLADGRIALPQGTVVSGQVASVVSGSNKIGGVPTLGLRFEQIELADGRNLPVSGEITETGRSDTARDTAKIAGGAAAGAIIGNQIGHGKGNKVIGGLIGGALGAVAAQKTGTEVELAAGTPLAIALTSTIELTLP